jgi:hypothetical protein
MESYVELKVEQSPEEKIAEEIRIALENNKLNPEWAKHFGENESLYKGVIALFQSYCNTGRMTHEHNGVVSATIKQALENEQSTVQSFLLLLKKNLLKAGVKLNPTGKLVGRIIYTHKQCQNKYIDLVFLCSELHPDKLKNKNKNVETKELVDESDVEFETSPKAETASTTEATTIVELSATDKIQLTIDKNSPKEEWKKILEKKKGDVYLTTVELLRKYSSFDAMFSYNLFNTANHAEHIRNALNQILIRSERKDKVFTSSDNTSDQHERLKSLLTCVNDELKYELSKPEGELIKILKFAQDEMKKQCDANQLEFVPVIDLLSLCIERQEPALETSQALVCCLSNSSGSHSH